jgi:hypothetical protein
MSPVTASSAADAQAVTQFKVPTARWDGALQVAHACRAHIEQLGIKAAYAAKMDGCNRVASAPQSTKALKEIHEIV